MSDRLEFTYLRSAQEHYPGDPVSVLRETHLESPGRTGLGLHNASKFVILELIYLTAFRTPEHRRIREKNGTSFGTAVGQRPL